MTMMESHHNEKGCRMTLENREFGRIVIAADIDKLYVWECEIEE